MVQDLFRYSTKDREVGKDEGEKKKKKGGGGGESYLKRKLEAVPS